MSTHNTETIAAQATPAGRGGIAIIRISGPLVKTVIHHILRQNLKPRQATHLPFLDANNNILDEGVAIYFPNPHSFTGEDVLELQGHAGPVIVDLLLQHILTLGVRLARPGEFSERAFLNNKIDLAQAEAISDLINATSEKAARSAVRSLQGEFSQLIHALNEKIIHLRIFIEAAIDFTDEEIDFLTAEKVNSKLQTILDDLTHIQSKAKQGSFLREGISAVIVGQPNVGKSSLLNALSGKDVAIVTDIPGTTRDVLRDYILIDGMPMHIIDTAGIRESDDVVEREGIRRAYQEIAQADIVLYMQDASKNVAIDLSLLPAETSQRPIIFIRNKIDLLQESASIKQENNKTVISLSAKQHHGIDLLKKYIKSLVGFESDAEGIFIARRRHLDALSRAQMHVSDSLQQLLENHSTELAAEDLRLAQRALGEITGEFTADDLLGRIFSSFCIGK